MYTLVAYQQDYDYLDGPYIYQFTSKESMDKAEIELNMAGFTTTSVVIPYTSPIKYYSLSTDLFSKNGLINKISSKITTLASYHPPTLIPLKLPEYNRYEKYLGVSLYCYNLDELQRFQEELESIWSKYKHIKFAHFTYFQSFLWVDQTIPRFQIQMDNYKFWSDGEFISAPKYEPSKSIFDSFNIKCSG